MIQPAMFPVNQQYHPVSPGVVAAATVQSPVMSPPISTRPGPHMRLPMVSPTGGVMDSGGGIPSPSGHMPSGGVTLVRPVAQVATPTRVSMVLSHSQGPNTVIFLMSVHFSCFSFVLLQASFKFDMSPTSAMVQSHGGYSIGQPVGGPLMHAGGINSHQQQRALMAAHGTQLAEHMEQLALDARVGRNGEGGGEMRLGQIGEGVGKKQGVHDASQNGKSPVIYNGSFPPGYTMMSAVEAGQMISPTQLHPAAVQFLPAHLQHPGPHMIPAGTHQDPTLVSPQHIPPGTPGGVLHYPGSLPNQSPNAPTTPPVGHMGFPTLPSMLSAQQQQSVFSPPSTGVTHSPVQILGHTLGTSLFSPPPSSNTHPGMFINSPTTGGKVIGYPPGSPAHAPVGSGLRFRRFESPKQGCHVSEVSSASVSIAHGQSNAGVSQVQFMPESPVPQPQQNQHRKTNNGANGGGNLIPGQSGFQPVQLPPRLVSQQQTAATTSAQRNTGTRYQNQRHPANRGGTTQGNKVKV